MHILFLVDKLRKAGTQGQLMMLAEGLAASGDRVTLIQLEPSTAGDEMLPMGVELRNLPVGSLSRPGSLRGIHDLVREIRNLRPDILHTYLFKANLLGALAVRLAGVPVLVGSRRSLGYDLNGLRSLALRFTHRFTDALVANSTSILEAALQAEGAPHPLGLVIANGVEDQGLACDGRCASRLGILANLRPVKGQDIALRTLRILAHSHPDVELHLMGDRRADPEWTARIDDLALDLDVTDRIRWHPADTPRAEFLGRIDVLLQSSRSEGLANALLEGMAAGKAIVATDVGGTRTALDDAGLLVPADDVAAMVTAARRLLDDSDLRRELGAAARRRVLARYGRDALITAHRRLYQGLLKSATPRSFLWSRTPRRGLLIAIDELDHGGTERQIEHWVTALRNRGLPVSVACLRHGGRSAERLTAAGVPVHQLGKRRPLDLGFLGRQQRLLRRLRPASVMALLTTAGLWTVPASRLAGVPRVIFSARGTAITNERDRRGPRRLLALSLRLAHRVLVNSEQVRDFCLRGLELPTDLIELVPNAIDVGAAADLDRIELRDELGLPQDTPLFGIVGRLAEIKNHELFLDAAALIMARMPQARAVIVGDGPRADWLRREVRGRDLAEKTIIMGHREDATRITRALDLLLLSSHSEGSPNVVAEAIMVGTPVVSVDVGGVCELLRQGAGKIVAPGDAEALAGSAIEHLKSLKRIDPGFRRLSSRHEPAAVASRLCGILLPDGAWSHTDASQFRQGDDHVSATS